ncbi:PREDICTED: tctex1 domain-containing protein 1-like [Dinoponera quadriceps]|uniref:Tctex1 domain-containing protein 1-like n=1 Tax=Dinoponera quadriceps TaxID=609295 RepID=A0A6P3WZQ1_DINQU|nr:PREDICTED: tctex1 domain-containing protein 1-like [Dinoponera quadriceps]
MPLQPEVNDKICDDNEAPKYHNTYRTEPRNPFKIDQVDKIVKSVMNNRLEELTYDDAECVKLCGDIAAEIRRRVKKLNFNRYSLIAQREREMFVMLGSRFTVVTSRHKIVVVVTIIEKVSQSLETTIGYLWDSEKDNYSVFSFEGRTFHAHCCVFGLYYE